MYIENLIFFFKKETKRPADFPSEIGCMYGMSISYI